MGNALVVPDNSVKNAIINGGFTINQRVYGSSDTLASGSYGHDRWKSGTGGGDYTFTQLASNTQITVENGKTLIQVIEDKNVVGGTYTLSWTGTAQGRYAVDSATPTGSYVDSPIVITGQTAGTVMSVEFDDGTLGTVQLESGSVATPFEQRLYGEELALCQRYYERFTFTSAFAVAFVVAISITRCQGIMTFFPKRIPPTIAITGSGYVVNGVVSPAFNAVIAYYSGVNKAQLDFSVTTPAPTAGHGYYLTSNTTTDYIEINSEL